MHLKGFIAFMLLTALLQSCSSFHFSGPQPADRPDEKYFPTELRGLWKGQIEDDKAEGTADLPIYSVEKNGIWVYGSTEEKLTDRVAPVRNPADPDPQAGNPYRPRRELFRNGESGQTDTLDNYIIRGDLIYAVLDTRLSKGEKYRRIGDTITYTRHDTSFFSIGKDILLRKAGKGLYLLNFRDGMDQDVLGWWTIIMAEVQGDSVLIHTPAEKMKTHPSLIGKLNNRYFFEMDFRGREARQLIDDGWFEQAIKFSR